MISLRSGLCILASTGVSLQKVVPLGIHTNVNTYAAVSYWSCFVFFCRRFWRFFIICFLSPSCVVRYLHLQFVVSGLLAGSLCVLLRIRACTCAVSFMLSFVPCSLDSNFIFRFVVVHSSQVYLVWLYDHHLRRVLVASNRPPFVLIRSYIWIQAALLRIAAPAKLSHVILRALPRFRYFPRFAVSIYHHTP